VGNVVEITSLNKRQIAVSPKKNTSMLARARAIHELQMQQGFAVSGHGSVFPVEFLTEAQWKALKSKKPLLLLSAARAAVLGLRPAKGVVAIEAGTLGLSALWQLTSAARPRNKPTQALPPEHAGAMISLAKRSGILPALIFVPGMVLKDGFALTARALADDAPAEVVKGETVALPIEGAANSKLTSFRTQHGAGVHLALTVGSLPKNKAPLVRVHSSCVTGDLLGSLRCDCGGQLQKALSLIKKEGGILLYLYQEGRDIGITSKLRAYHLQEQGSDTFEANQQLGFEEDERDLSIAGAILESMGIKKIRLLTNNPAKIEWLEDSGIRVSERVPLVTGHNTHNHHYIATKKKKGGHLL